MRRLVLLIASGLVAACTSPSELYDRGERYEREGRYEEAADHYVRALEREPDMRKAQGRLSVVGRHLLTRYLEAEAGAATYAPDAADAYLRADALVQRAAGVGVRLAAPLSFEADRDAALARAVEALEPEAWDLVEAGRYEEALAAAERARRYRPAPDWAASLDAAERTAYARWAEADRAAGRYRAALAHADEALRRTGPDSPEGADLVLLRDRILEEATVNVAFFPVEQRGRDELPPGFLRDLDDRLEDDHRQQPRLFIRPLDPTEVRRVIRYTGEERFYEPATAAHLGRRLDADVTVAVTVQDFDRTARVTDTDTLTADLRSGGTARYFRVQHEVTLRAWMDVTVVEVASRQVLCSGAGEYSESGEAAWYDYDGRVADLDLPRDERRRFGEEGREEAERGLVEDLTEELVRSAARRAAGCLDRLIP